LCFRRKSFACEIPFAFKIIIKKKERVDAGF